MDIALHYILISALILLALIAFACLIRAILGPSVADRLMAVNMMGTIVMVMIAILTVLLKEGYLADICIIYAMISFLSLIVLAKVYIGTYVQKGEDNK